MLIVAAGHAAHDTYTAFLPALLPLFIAGMLLSRTEAGLLSIFLQLPWLLQPWIGHKAGSRSIRWIVILAPTVSAVSMSLIGTAPGYGFLVLLLVAAGTGSAAFHAVGPALISGISGNRIGKGMGLWMVGGELGRTIGPVVAVTAVGRLTLGGLPWLMIGGCLASFVLYRQLGGIEEGDGTQAPPIPVRKLLRGIGPLLLPIAGIMLFRSFLLEALKTYLPVFLTDQGARLWFAGISLTLFEGAGVIGALLGGSVSDRIGRRVAILVSLTLTPIFLFLFLYTGGATRMVFLFLLGLTGLSVSPVIMALLQETYPGNRAMVNGVYMVLSFGIRSVAVLSLGVAGDLVGMRTAYMGAAAIALIGIPLVRLLPRRRIAGRG